MTEISHADRRLSIDGVDIQLRHSVKEIVEIDDLIIVLLKVPQEETDNRNVLAFDRDGSRRWTIERSDDEGRDNPYMSIEDNDGDLVAETWGGIQYDVDLKTGSIRDGQLRRF